MLESARIYGAKGIGRSALTMGVDSVYSLYQRELYDTYRLFGYNLSDRADKTIEEQIIESIKTYMEDELQGIKLDSMRIDNVAMLTDYNGELFLNEVLSFMKYSAPEEIIKSVLERWKLYESSEDTSEVMKKKLETQESLGELSKDMLKLMTQVEGINTDGDGICVTKGGSIEVKNIFAKRIIAKTASRDTVGINKEIVYSSLASKYYNIASVIENDIKCSDKVIACNEAIEELQKEKNRLEEKKSLEGQEIAQENLESEEVSTEELEKSISHVSQQIQEEEMTRDKYVADLKKSKEYRDEVIITTSKKIEDSLITIAKIEDKSKEISQDINSYEKILEGKREVLNEDTYKEFEEELVEMKEYVGMQENSNSLSASSAIAMRPILIKNKDILEVVYSTNIYSINSESEVMKEWKRRLQSCKNVLTGYQVSNLKFDYSTLVIKADVESPVNHIWSLFTEGILSLVMEDSNAISQGSLEMENLPSVIGSIQTNGKEKDCESILESCKDNQYSSDITNMFVVDNSTINDLVERLLLNQYQMDFFKEYTQQEKESLQNNKESKENENNEDESNENNSKKNAELQYELEYIISGHKTDKENLSSVATKIVLIRTLMNFVYVYTDKGMNASAYATATALVGFSCLMPLIKLVKAVILLVWAMAEALVDTYALLEGRYVPFIKSKETFKVSYNHLITMSKDKIAQLASKYSKDNGGIETFAYGDYLRLFLILNGTKKNCYRSMDMIQMNMQKVLGLRFCLSDCLFGMEVLAYMKLPEQFITFPFMKRVLGETEGYYSFEIKNIDAY